MPRTLAALALSLVPFGPGLAEQADQAIHLKIRPAAAPVPALKYQVLPDPMDLSPGNAAQLYYRALSPTWQNRFVQREVSEKIAPALHAPLDQLPRKDWDWLRSSKMLQEVDRAARRAYVDWDYLPRIREEGARMVLPDVQDLRAIADVLAVRTRVQIADGQIDQAAYSLQTEFAMARHVATAPVLINVLVGAAIARTTFRPVEDLIQAPGSPNLYWALSVLPRPMFPLRDALGGEKLFLQAEMPLLPDLAREPCGADRQEELLRQALKLGQLLHESQKDKGWTDRAWLMAIVKGLYPDCRRALIATGHDAEIIAKMSQLQVVLLHCTEDFRRYQDELFKWHDFPYWQARPGLLHALNAIEQAKGHKPANPLLDLLPAMHRAQSAVARIDRRIAALRCVEAIRFYAAAHDGRLPASLDDIHEVPVPIDPMTGKPFDFKSKEGRATLTGTAIDPTDPNTAALVYELTLDR